MAEGRIIKALSGFYYVKSEDTIFACKGRGVFRKRKVSPLVGDFVSFQVTDELEGYITEIKPRDNALKRPPIANINQAVIVSSAKMPDFSPLLLDRFLVLVESKQIDPIIFITKMDLLTESEQATIEAFASDYADIGYDVECLTSKTGHDLTYLEEYFNDKVDRKSTRLNSSHVAISYAVFCLKKKKDRTIEDQQI